MYKFNGFTENANKAMNYAIENAQQLGHTYIGTEHILLGLLQENSGVAYVALTNSGIYFEYIENIIKEKIGIGSMTRLTTDDLTPRSKRVIQMALVIATRHGHSYVGTEHLLIALLDDSESYAVRIISDTGTTPAELIDSIRVQLTSSGNNIGNEIQNNNKSNPHF